MSAKLYNRAGKRIIRHRRVRWRLVWTSNKAKWPILTMSKNRCQLLQFKTVRPEWSSSQMTTPRISPMMTSRTKRRALTILRKPPCFTLQPQLTWWEIQLKTAVWNALRKISKRGRYRVDWDLPWKTQSRTPPQLSHSWSEIKNLQHLQLTRLKKRWILLKNRISSILTQTQLEVTYLI